MNGIFAVYKPKGMTSHDVVNQVRKITGVKRVGHGGTLDPLATGVLVIAVGRENTKQLEQYVKGEKEYIAKIKLGYESTTDDEEGKKTEINISKIPTRNDIVRSTQKFIGLFPQTPPIYSAKKVRGKRSYRLARQGLNIKLEPKMVTIMQIKISSFTCPFIKLRVTTGSGVYIRSLARDIGQDLGTGAYLADLERIKVAGFTKNDCITLEQLEKLYQK